MNELEKISNEISTFRDKSAKSMLESFLGVGVMIAEITRTRLVPTSSFLYNPKYNPDLPEHIIKRKYHPFIYDTLQNMGDIFEGYMIPFFINNLLRYAVPKSSENLRLGISLAISDLFIFAAESGIIIKEQTPDYSDLPAAVFGNLLYVGANFIGRNQKYNIFYDILKR